MQKRKLLLVFFSLLLSISITVAQDVCPTIVADALTATGSACSGIGRNQACYGNVQISAELADSALPFEKQGDIVELTNLQRLTLAPYDKATSAWGVALMNVQANIPDTMPGQGVTFLLFGDVDITNAGDSMEAFYFSSGVGTAGCNEAQSGIIINTPEGVGTVSLIANDVTIELGSTAVLTAIPDDVMTIALTEGNATVTAEGVSQEFEGDFQVTIPINEDLEAVGAPSEPEPIPEETTETLPDIFEFVADEEQNTDGGDNNDISDTGLVTDGGIIVPLTGNWSYTLETVSTTDGCPPGMGDAMSSSPIPTTFVEFGDTFDLQTMMESTTPEGMPPNTTYGNPASNVYTMGFTQEGVTVTWVMTLQSQSLMTGEFAFDMSSIGTNCAISVAYSVALQG
jgi:hypothetical protein